MLNDYELSCMRSDFEDLKVELRKCDEWVGCILDSDKKVFNRKELSDILTPYQFKKLKVEPDYKEPFVIEIDGEKIHSCRYWYSKGAIINAVVAKKRNLIKDHVTPLENSISRCEDQMRYYQEKMNDYAFQLAKLKEILITLG